jgi:cytochrome c oxidase subunit 4
MSHDHIVSPKLYLGVLAILLVGTGLTVAAARVDLGGLNIVVAMSIAVIKASFVVLYFMHLKYSHRLNWVFGAAAMLWLALLIGLTWTDVAARLTE